MQSLNRTINDQKKASHDEIDAGKKKFEEQFTKKQIEDLNKKIQKCIDNKDKETNYDELKKITDNFVSNFKIGDTSSESINKECKDATEIVLGFFKQLDSALCSDVEKIIDGENDEICLKKYNKDDVNEKDFDKKDEDGHYLYMKDPNTVRYKDKTTIIYMPCKGTIEDIFLLAHELSHTFDIPKVGDNKTRNLLGEVTPFCIEDMLGDYLVNKGIITKENALCREKGQTLLHYDDGIETYVKLKLMDIKDQKGEITREDLKELFTSKPLNNMIRRPNNDIINDINDSPDSVDHNARYMMANLIVPTYMKEYTKDSKVAINNLNKYFKYIKKDNQGKALKALGIGDLTNNQVLEKLINEANTRIETVNKELDNLRKGHN